MHACLMGSQLKQLVVPCFGILLPLLLLLLLLIIIPSSHARSCQCPESDQHGRMDDTSFTTNLGAINNTHSILTESGFLDGVTSHQLVDMRDRAAAAQGLLYIHDDVELVSLLWSKRHKRFRVVAEASFSVSFTMSVVARNLTATQGRKPGANGIALIFLPYGGYLAEDANVSLTKQLSLDARGSLPLSNPTDTTFRLTVRGGAEVFVKIGKLPFRSVDRPHPYYHVPGVNITITEPVASAKANDYTVWIDYNRLGQRLSVYVDASEVKAKPGSAIAFADNVSFSEDVYYWYTRFGLLSSMEQLLQVHTFSCKVEGLPDLYAAWRTKVIVLSVVATVAATILVVAGVGVACYMRSKQRRWKMEQEKLAKTMQRLPGVPTQVDFADIRKATGNFHEAMKLGKGGFSSVYRCKLPAAASKRTSKIGEMEVAIKKFTREVEERRYEDFLAEVSIINRLRHKNIVPLVGWSYHKGAPLLIYEYMTNGSLDQHLFRRDGTGQLLQRQDSPIRQWDTRYSIAKDIATGLHYVHHEHEPMVLHRDIKASNIMLDSTFRARLGDFGIACTVAEDRSSVTGVAGTWGYISPEYAMSHRATRQTDIYAFGVLILEVVTGKKNREVPPDDGHISDWVWRLHGEGKLLEAVDDGLVTAGDQELDFADEAIRLLLLGLACTNPNPSNRPSMAEAVQVITKLAPPPDVPPERPTFVWPPEEWRSLDSDYSTTVSNLEGSWASTVELVQTSQEQPRPGTTQSTTFFSV